MRPRNLLILALVVAGLAAFIWFVERDLPSTEERKERAKLALGVEADEIEALVLEPAGGVAVRLERTGPPEGEAAEGDAAEWRLTEPLAARAASNRVASLTDALATLEKERTLEEVDEEAMGLASPRARFTVVTEAGEQAWRVGAEIPASSRMIVQREGSSEAYVVVDTLLDDLTRPAADWRSRELFDGERSEVRRMVLRRGDEPLVLARREEGFWLEAPRVDLADDDEIQQLLGDLVGLRVEEFVDDPPPAAEIGLEPPEAVLEVVHGETERTFRLELGRLEPSGDEAEGEADEGDEPPARRRYARVDGQVVTIGDDLDEALSMAPEEWQARAWTSFESWQVERLWVRDAEGEVELERDGGDWRRGGETIGYDAVSDLLYAVADAEAERLLPPSEGELPERELELRLEGEDRGETLRLYPATGEGHPAVTEGRAYRLLLPGAMVEELRATIAAVREAEVESEETAPESGEEEGVEPEL